MYFGRKDVVFIRARKEYESHETTAIQNKIYMKNANKLSTVHKMDVDFNLEDFR